MPGKIIALLNSPVTLNISTQALKESIYTSTVNNPDGDPYTFDRYKGGHSNYIGGIKGTLTKLETSLPLRVSDTWIRIGRSNDVNDQYREIGVMMYDEEDALLFGLSTDMWTGAGNLILWTPWGSVNTNDDANITDIHIEGKDNLDGTATYTITSYNASRTQTNTLTTVASDEYLDKRINQSILMGGESYYGDDANIYLFILTSGLPTFDLYPVPLNPESITESTVESVPTVDQLQLYGANFMADAPAIYGSKDTFLFYKATPMLTDYDVKFRVRGLILGARADSPDTTGLQFSIRTGEGNNTEVDVGGVHDITDQSYTNPAAIFLADNPVTGKPWQMNDLTTMELGIKFKERT